MAPDSSRTSRFKERIVIKGAREHNLKNISLEIPRNRLVVITGLSGSGKSTLAFDTIFAEGQRRYVESLSAYARQFLEQMEKPDVDYIEGLSPAISIEQKATSRNPRSTVGTVTEIYDYLRVLFARVGTPHCPACGKEISSQTPQEIVDHILRLPERTRVQLLAPLVRGRKGEYRKLFDDVRRQGYVRVRVDGDVLDLGEDIVLDKYKKHDIDVVVDRLVIKSGIEKRLTDSVETTLKLGAGILRLVCERPDGRRTESLRSEHFACVDCGVNFEELEPRMFSFNSPHGACPACTGLGTTMDLDPDLVVPDKSLSLEQGAVKPFVSRSGSSTYYNSMVRQVASHYGVTETIPYREIPEDVQQKLLYGTGDEQIEFVLKREHRRHVFRRPFEGVINNMARRFKESGSQAVRDELGQYMAARPCRACGGARLRPESLAVMVGESSITEVTALSIKRALTFFKELELTPSQQTIARRILKEIRDRLKFMMDVGLDYLTLDRHAGSLSGGESQRIRLATQIGAGLVGVLYILDEPTIGLHQRDNKRLLATLLRLRDLGNTVIVVEHDEQTIRAADYIVDLGPGAGAHGGRVVATGTPKGIMRSRKSLTGRYLKGDLEIEVPEERRTPDNTYITVFGARHNNLKGIDVSFPVGVFTCVTGVSGSGKSSLVNETLYPIAARELHRSHAKPGAYERIAGLDCIDKVIDIDQSPIGRTPRSNPATYTGLFTFIREIFSKVPESRARGYRPGRFSFNVKGGRCEACKGDGLIRIEMHFLPDVYVTCEVCRGQRYNRDTLEIRYKGRTIAEVLEMTVEEALAFFRNVPRIKRKLQTLYDVGLGYIKLGQSSTTLSGGEAQRVKLATELSRVSTGRTLYMLDEPTTGLHVADIDRLLDVLHRLTSAGNTVVVIEHNLDVIKTADHIIDLGPEGGDEGGYVVATGTPEEVAAERRSYTGKFLRAILSPARRRQAAS